MHSKTSRPEQGRLRSPGMRVSFISSLPTLPTPPLCQGVVSCASLPSCSPGSPVLGCQIFLTRTFGRRTTRVSGAGITSTRATSSLTFARRRYLFSFKWVRVSYKHVDRVRHQWVLGAAQCIHLGKEDNTFLDLIRWASKQGFCPFPMVPLSGASSLTLIGCSKYVPRVQHRPKLVCGLRAAEVLQQKFASSFSRSLNFVLHVWCRILRSDMGTRTAGPCA